MNPIVVIPLLCPSRYSPIVSTTGRHYSHADLSPSEGNEVS